MCGASGSDHFGGGGTMDQERAPEAAHDGAPLTAAERAAIADLARRTAARDPGLARRLDGFGGYEVSPLGLPSRWTALPAALVAAVIAVGAFLGIGAAGGGAAPTTGTAHTLHLE